MKLRSLPALRPYALARDPWGLEPAFRFRIYPQSRTEFVEAVKKDIAEQSERQMLAQFEASNRLQLEAGSGRRLSRKGKREVAHSIAASQVKTLDLQEVSKTLAGDSLKRRMAQWLFEIEDCNVYGSPIDDTAENRLRLLTDLQQPLAGDDGKAWHSRNGGSPEYYWLPRYLPDDESRTQEWLDLIAQHTDIEDARDAFSGDLHALDYVDSDDEDTSAAPKAGAYLQDMLLRFIADFSNNDANFLPGARSEAEDFLDSSP